MKREERNQRHGYRNTTGLRVRLSEYLQEIIWWFPMESYLYGPGRLSLDSSICCSQQQKLTPVNRHSHWHFCSFSWSLFIPQSFFLCRHIPRNQTLWLGMPLHVRTKDCQSKSCSGRFGWCLNLSRPVIFSLVNNHASVGNYRTSGVWRPQCQRGRC